MSRPVGRPPKYKSVEEIEQKIEAYFKSCEGEPLKDRDGTVLTDKYGAPIIVGKRPPTVTGLALALGFASRQALLNYQGRKQFNDTITRAKTYVEQYAEERLFDREGVQGAKFSLVNNFKGWSEKPESESDAELLQKAAELLGGVDSVISPKQQEFLQNCNHRWNIKTGATRSGKTFLDYTVIPKRILKCRGEGLIVLLGNTKGTLERNILEPMRAIWSPALVGQIGSNNTVQIFGKKCHALGADKISQVSKLQGAAFEYCYGDEITTWHEDVFQMLKSRLSCPNSHFDGTCNPGNPQHWFKKFLDSDADIYRQAYTIDDNPFLAPEFVENLKREYAGTVYYNRFILGEWAAAEGVIYQDFANSVASRDERFVWKGKELPLMAVNIGVDFGGNGSKHAFVATGILSGYSGVVLLASRRVEPSTPQALEKAFVDFCAAVHLAYRRIDHIYCDSAEQVLIRGMQIALQRSELSFAASRVSNAAKIEINDRIRLVSVLMGAGRFWYLPEAGSARDALAAALWSTKDPTKDERLDDGSTDIDTLDALEYSIERDYKRFLKARGHT